MAFVDDVRALLAEAAELSPEVDAIAAHLDAPLRVAIAGRVKAGKSTLLNALVGEELAPTDAGECTEVVWWFHDGLTYRATLYEHSGTQRPLRFTRDGGALDIDLGGAATEDIDRIDIEWPSRALRSMTLIDTPGIASATATLSERAMAFLSPDDERSTTADAVIYLMRHMHADDARFLEAFHDDEHAQATPINTIAVLSRADEMGVGRVDAMTTAERIARRYREDRRVRRLCQEVVPVAGLLAQAAVTLRESEYRLLAALVSEPHLDDLLLSVDHFTLGASEVAPTDRAALLERFGLFGVRYALSVLPSVSSAAQLAAALQEASGLDALKALLATQFTARRDILKGRAALLALEAMLTSRSDADHLLAEIERIRSTAHELSELRLLNGLRSGAVMFDEQTTAEAEQLLSGSPIAPDADPRATLERTLAAWQRRAENPLASPDAVEAARVIVRMCERQLVALP